MTYPNPADLNPDFHTPSMRLVQLQSALHWLFPMRHNRQYRAAVRHAIALTVQAGKAARLAQRTAA